MPRVLRFPTTLLTVTYFALCLVPSATAQQTAGVRGTVIVAETGQPVRGAVITVEGSGARAQTGADGRFVLRGLPVGEVTLIVRTLGREPLRRVESLRPGGPLELRVEVPSLPVRLEAIEILRSRSEIGRAGDIPGSVHVIEVGEEQYRNAYHDVHRVLRRVPGVNVQDEEGFGLRPNIGLRGSGSERSAKINVMEDGVLIAPAPYAAPAAYYFPAAGRMSALEVRKGASQIKYGPRTVGGTINLVSTPIPDRASVALDVAGGSHQSRRAKARYGGARERIGWMVQGYGLGSDGFKDLAAGGTGFALRDVLAKVRVNTGDAALTYHALEFKLGYTDQTSDETYLGLTDSNFAVHPLARYPASQRDVLETEHNEVSLRHFVRAGRFDLTTTAYRTGFSRNWYKLQSVAGTGIGTVLADPGAFAAELDILRGGDSGSDALRVRANRRSYYATGVQSVAGLEFGRRLRHTFELGVRWHRDQEDRFQHEDAYRMTAGQMVLTDPGAPGSQANRVVSATALAAYAQDRIGVGRWAFTPGVRVEVIDLERTDYDRADPARLAPSVRSDRVAVVTPGLGVHYEARPGLEVFGGVHRGFAPPGPGADTTTAAERSTNYEVGVRQAGGAWRGEIVTYANDYANLLGASTLSSGGDGSGDQFNGGAALVWGVEGMLQYDPAAGSGTAIPARISVTYTNATFRSDFSSGFEPWGEVRSGDALPYVAPWQVHASVGVRRTRWEAAAALSHASSMRTVAGRGTPLSTERTDTHTVLDLSLQYRVNGWTAVYANVQNVADAAYVVSRRPAGLRPGLPRTLAVGIGLAR